MSWIKGCFCSCVAVLVIPSIYIYYSLSVKHSFKDLPLYEVAQGQSFSGVLHDLSEYHVIQSPTLLKLYAFLVGVDSKLHVGEYAFTPPMSSLDVLNVLIKGKVIYHAVSFIEGTRFIDNFYKIRGLTNINKTLNSVSELQAKMKHVFGVDGSLEGLFYADTYKYSSTNSDWDIWRQAHLRLQQTLDLLWSKRQANLPYADSYQALILASIIEKESFVASERSLIASVYINRLQNNMRLQADPSVIYGLQLLGQYSGNLTKKNLRIPTQYNSYMYKGLPVTPISIVGYESIEAALNPALTDYLYFVAKKNGSHYLSRNLSDHNRAVNLYQK
jgi:UPF0755 protein